MKRIVAGILALLYLSTSLGATVHLHYCMGKLLSWGLVNHESKDCGFCGMPKKADSNHCVSAKQGCCKDEQKQLKSGGDQKIFSSELQFKAFPQGYFISRPIHPDFLISSFVLTYPSTHAPPLSGEVAIFLLKRSFRI
jgi:hypothetical protein